MSTSTPTQAGTGTSGQTATDTTTGQTSAGGGIDTLEGASTAPVVVRATNTETALLTDVRVARHEGFDRVVFEFRNALPGYDVRYVERPLLQDGSGSETAVNGRFIARIRMEHALDADLSKESAPRTYTGPDRFSPGSPEVVELVSAGGFEGVLTWAVGLGDRVDFRVLTLKSPARLVIDFRNH
ncbi:MAG: hypothetical protein LT070_08745 [Solirubrobacteraceae bacterium]|nr:hypothetical protein [Solirubrobacteraceae bacterium]